MQNFRTNITKRQVQKKHRDGRITLLDRYVLHYKDPATGKRRMRHFETRKEAEAAQNKLVKGADAMKRRKDGKTPNLREAVEYWLQSKETFITYLTIIHYLGDTIDTTFKPRSAIELEAHIEKPQTYSGFTLFSQELVRRYFFSHTTMIEQLRNKASSFEMVEYVIPDFNEGFSRRTRKTKCPRNITLSFCQMMYC